MMYRRTAACLITATAILAAETSSIGVVSSNGSFRMDGASVRGNSTLFEGSKVETAAVRSLVQVSGAQLTVLPNSSVRLYQHHAVLEKGTGAVRNGAGFVLEAGSLRIAPKSAGSTVQVEMPAPGRVTVSSRSGAAEVRNSAGTLLASLRPGMSVAFQPQAAGNSTMRLAGTVEQVQGKFYLTDQVSGIRVELVGPRLASFVGRQVSISGSLVTSAQASAGAAPVVQVVAITPVSAAAGGSAAGGAAGAGGGAGGGAGAGAGAAGLSWAAKAAIIGGLAAGGTATGLYSAGVFGGSASISRP